MALPYSHIADMVIHTTLNTDDTVMRLRQVAVRPPLDRERPARSVARLPDLEHLLRVPTPGAGRRFIAVLVDSRGSRCWLRRAVTASREQTAAELPDIRGNQMYDLHAAVLMCEHGVSRICIRDTASPVSAS